MQLMIGAGYDMNMEFDWMDGRYIFNGTLPGMNQTISSQ